ncbi:GGDEF domain-containing protein [Paraferrimonas sedimenticola]|uniref:Diguanylate cyclase DosC n=1 Tax=Paraferrimonas sedimenticola TaxID=375674 RepID=A0AA37RTN4_9GAMM|nr:GGDEF domain-containing protein [Paraferrimonas sedimenticola]GLP95480.1 sensor histidine kinase [Paraferrimonas sedimenticola]
MQNISQSLAEQLRIGELELSRRKRLLDFDHTDAANLLECLPLIAPRIGELVNDFYLAQTQQPEISLIIGDKDTLSRLHGAMRRYVTELFSGDYDGEYVSSRLKIGQVHHRIGVSPKLYLSGINQLTGLLETCLQELLAEHEERFLRTRRSLQKLMLLDNQLVFDTYIAALQSEIENVNHQLEEYASSLEQTVAQRTQELTDLSNRDPLTGIFNQRAAQKMFEPLKQLADQSLKPICLWYLDVNHFKMINDGMGHSQGDKVLQQLADTIDQTIKQLPKGAQGYASRFGGDEFCVAIFGLGDAQQQAQIQQFFGRLKAIKAVSLSVSLGAAFYSPGHGIEPTLEDLISRADSLMYMAKAVAHGSGDNEVMMDNLPEDTKVQRIPSRA